MPATRAAVLGAVAARLLRSRPGHPLRVGVDGVCGVGKSTFARDLAAHVGALGATVLHIGSDGFHHVRAVRYRRGRDSARGYYEDAYDFDSLRDLVLVLLARGSARVATRVHDLATDAVVREWALVPAEAIVLFDATFLQRGGLRDHWDEVIFLDAPEASALARGVGRDAGGLGGVAAARAAYETRYMAACRIYRTEQDPLGRATIVVDHDDPGRPRLVP